MTQLVHAHALQQESHLHGYFFESVKASALRKVTCAKQETSLIGPVKAADATVDAFPSVLLLRCQHCLHGSGLESVL